MIQSIFSILFCSIMEIVEKYMKNFFVSRITYTLQEVLKDQIFVFLHIIK